MASIIDHKMASNERTPLITTIRVAPPRQRYSHGIVRRFCTIALSASLIALVVLFLLPVSLLDRRHHHHRRPSHPSPSPPDHGRSALSFKELQEILIETP